MVHQLIEFAYAMGYELTYGDAYRDPRLHGPLGTKMGYGNSRSCHKIRLAVDFNLFIDGEYKTDEESYRPLTEYWKSIGGSAGADFGDANHFSLEHNGVR